LTRGGPTLVFPTVRGSKKKTCRDNKRRDICNFRYSMTNLLSDMDTRVNMDMEINLMRWIFPKSDSAIYQIRSLHPKHTPFGVHSHRRLVGLHTQSSLEQLHRLVVVLHRQSSLEQLHRWLVEPRRQSSLELHRRRLVEPRRKSSLELPRTWELHRIASWELLQGA